MLFVIWITVRRCQNRGRHLSAVSVPARFVSWQRDILPKDRASSFIGFFLFLPSFAFHFFFFFVPFFPFLLAFFLSMLSVFFSLPSVLLFEGEFSELYSLRLFWLFLILIFLNILANCMVSKISTALAAIMSVIDRFREFLGRFFLSFQPNIGPLLNTSRKRFSVGRGDSNLFVFRFDIRSMGIVDRVGRHVEESGERYSSFFLFQEP